MSLFRRAGRPVLGALERTLADRRQQALLALSFPLTLAVYAVTLPATYTGGRVGLISLRFLTPTLAGFAVVMAGLVSLLLVFNTYAVAVGASTSTRSTTGGLVASVVPPLVCCSPLVPTVVAGIAAVTGLSPLVAGMVQGLIVTYELHILTAATLALAYAVYTTARSITTDRCSP